jgi:hypothetical protein
MNQIADISKYSFKLDFLNNKWMKVDKCLIKEKRFKSLKIGDFIQIIERKENGTIIDIRKIDTIEVSIRW